MMKKSNNSSTKDFSYKVGNIDEVIDTKGNQVMLLRKIAWGDSETERLELRRWVVDMKDEKPLKGVTFLTENGPEVLTNTLIKLGYGNTKEILKTLSEREDFSDAMSTYDKKIVGKKSSKYIDPKEVLTA